MGIMDKIRGVFGGADDEDYDDNEEYTDEVLEEDYAPAGHGTAVPLKTATTRGRGRIVVKTVNSFEDAKHILDLLQQRNSVVFNLSNISTEEQTRLLDFVAGACHFSKSELKATGHMTFLVAPVDVDVVVQAPADGGPGNQPDYY